MSTKKLPTNEDLDAMFAGIDDTDSPTTNNTTVTTTSSGTSTKKPTPTSTEADDDDPLAELANLAAAPRVSSSLSRPQTPRSLPGGRAKADVVHTPTSTVASGRTSEDREQSSGSGSGLGSGQKGYSGQGVAQSAAPSTEQTTQAEVQEPEQGGGWGGWGGWATSLASAAVKQAQGAVKEIQKNEEAQKWAEQVKGYGALNIRGLGMCLVSRLEVRS